MTAKTGRNAPCYCGSGVKYKKCCLAKETISKSLVGSPMRAVKISDIGTSYPAMARLGMGLMELLDFSNLPKATVDFIKEKGLEMAQLLAKAEASSKPIITEINGVLHDFGKTGVPLNEEGHPYLPKHCQTLFEAQKFLFLCEKVMDCFYGCFNRIWDLQLNRREPTELKEFLLNRFGDAHVLHKLILTDLQWLSELNQLIELTAKPFAAEVQDFQFGQVGPDGKYTITLPSFSNGLQIASYLEGLTYNMLTYIEEILVFSIAEVMDERLSVFDVPENMRDASAPVRFKVGVKPGIDLAVFKGHPKFDRIFRSGQPLFHMKDKLRESKFGRVRPIIHLEYQEKKTVAVGNTVYFGNWKTFVDFLHDYIKMKFGKDWWQSEAAKPDSSCSLVMIWARGTYKHQQSHSAGDGEIYSILSNGPMHAYLTLAYDLFVLEDNQKLQESLIQRLRLPNRPNFWGARYEAMVAATFIKAGFDVIYEDETDGAATHPEFIAVHRDTGERIAVEAKKRNRETAHKNANSLRVAHLMRSALSKFKGIPFILFLELDLAPISGDPMRQPWIKKLLDSHERAGARDADGKDFFNMVVFTNSPTEHPDGAEVYPSQTYIIAQSLVPKVPMKNAFHLLQIASAVEKRGKFPNWFDE